MLGRILLLFLDLVQLGIVTSEFLQCDEEVTQVESEFVVLRVETKQALNERSNLWSDEESARYTRNIYHDDISMMTYA